MMILLLIPLGIILPFIVVQEYGALGILSFAVYPFIGLFLIDKGGYRKTDLFDAGNSSTADIKAYKGRVIFTALISPISSFVSLAFR